MTIVHESGGRIPKKLNNASQVVFDDGSRKTVYRVREGKVEERRMLKNVTGEWVLTGKRRIKLEEYNGRLAIVDPYGRSKDLHVFRLEE